MRKWRNAIQRFVEGIRDLITQIAHRRNVTTIRPVHAIHSEPLPIWEPLSSIIPAADVLETDTAYIFRIDLPGFHRDDINIEVRGDYLVVTARTEQRHEERSAWHWITERRYGCYCRSFALPEDANTDDITARYRNGVLEVEVSKLSKPPKRIITVPIR
ncbi:MAG TPA: Hsp20/alpha crystallin family protein [Armatimonadetes bacterium]|nr:Hsp20/alpha crystallin family protein [Armatimonadota bacterium]